jgi:periplasmic protein TonB
MTETTSNTTPSEAQQPSAMVRIQRLAVPQESWWSSFSSNLKQFLTERPVKVVAHKGDFFKSTSFGAGMGENVKEFFHAAPPLQPGAPGSELLERPGQDFDSFWTNVRDMISPRKLPPLKTTSQPVAVKDIWTKDTQFTRVQYLSLAIHVVVLVLIIVPLLPEILSPSTTKASTQVVVTPLDFSPYAPKLPPGPHKAGGGGGGGEHNPIPASRGKLPKFSFTQFTPPSVKPPDNPRLAMTPTVLGPPDMKLPSPNAANWGDPLAKLTNDSSGPGGGGGIGSGQGGGVGSGNGGGVGPGEGWGTGGGSPHAGENGFGTPVCLYCPLPEFSDEAIKAKYSGTVLVQAFIGPDGRAKDIHVVKGLGLGLDEKAMEAVRGWRFRPANSPTGQASGVIALIEVTFRLM